MGKKQGSSSFTLHRELVVMLWVGAILRAPGIKTADAGADGAPGCGRQKPFTILLREGFLMSELFDALKDRALIDAKVSEFFGCLPAQLMRLQWTWLLGS